MWRLVPVLLFVTLGTVYAWHESEPACAALAGEEKRSCYERQFLAMLETTTPAQVFETLRVAQRADADLFDCYLIAHRVGEVAASREGWSTLLSEDPSYGMCSGGFVYGIAAGAADRIRAGAALAPAGDTCARALPVLRTGCEKALGSMLYRVASADIEAALDGCDAYTGALACYEGVFHDALMPLHDAVAFDSRRRGIDAENSEAFCRAFGDSGRVDTCLIGRWELLAESLVTGEAIDRFCAAVSRREARCTESMYRVLGWRFPDEPARIIDICETTAEPSACITEAAKDLVRNRGVASALTVCDAQPDAGSCRERVMKLSTAFAPAGSSGREALCAGLPATDHARCVAFE